MDDWDSLERYYRKHCEKAKRDGPIFDEVNSSLSLTGPFAVTLMLMSVILGVALIAVIGSTP